MTGGMSKQGIVKVFIASSLHVSVSRNRQIISPEPILHCVSREVLLRMFFLHTNGDVYALACTDYFASSLCTQMATPMPPPTHSAATPLLNPRRLSPYNKVTNTRAPEEQHHQTLWKFDFYYYYSNGHIGVDAYNSGRFENK